MNFKDYRYAEFFIIFSSCLDFQMIKYRFQKQSSFIILQLLQDGRNNNKLDQDSNPGPLNL